MLQRLMMGARALFDRARVESEMEKEMRLHLEMEAEANIRRGMSPADARRAALIAFGGVEKSKEATRDERSTHWLEGLGGDLRFAFRGMRKQPVFTVVVLALLALGTGANAAIFSLLDEKILRPFPFADGARMVELLATLSRRDFQILPSTKLIDLWAGRAKTVGEFARYSNYSGVYGDTTDGGGKRVQGDLVSPGMLKFTGLRPAKGRDFVPGDTLLEAPPVVMLGYAFWKKEFGGRDDVIGTTILLDGRPRTVIGVSPAGFFVPFSGSRGDLYMAMQANPRRGGSGSIAKLRPGVTIEQANRELLSLGSVAPEGLDFIANPPLIDDASRLTRADTRRVLYMLFGAVGLVLLIACANVANLLLTRAWSRQREFAVRGAMGASRGRIARQLFTESILLAIAGGAVGFLVAICLVKLLVAIQPSNVGIIGRIDSTVLGWTLVISVITGVLFGIAPAWLIGDGRMGDVLKASARATTGSRAARRLRAGLVVTEVSLSVVLLVGAGLMLRTIAAMQRADLGMNPRGMSSIVLRLRDPMYEDSVARADAWLTIERRIAATPGISAATMALTMPPEFGAHLRPIEIEGQPQSPGDSIGPIGYNLGQPDYFQFAGIRFLAGRPYAADKRFDEQAGASEIVVNDRAARRFWPAGALGARVKRNGSWATVVGVVPNVDLPGVKGIGSGIQVYQPLSQSPIRMAFLVRSGLPATVVEALLRKAIKESGVRAAIGEFSEANTQVLEGRQIHRFTMFLIGGFAVLAMLLAAIGLHAVVTYSVTQRLREMGIRVALGAQSAQVAGLVVREGAALAITGVVVGMLAAAAATRAMQSLLYDVKPGDPLATAVAAGMLLVVALVACAGPARRATRVDPVDLVRAE